jgi:hypothetical protein
MGYYTDYKLSWNGPGPSRYELIELTQEEDWEKNNQGFGLSETKWYQHEEHMLGISAKYHETLFKLDGEGEESGDVWRKFYKGGVMIKEWRVDATPPEEP